MTRPPEGRRGRGQRRLSSLIPSPVRHVGALSASTVAAQVILLIASPFLTRLFSPSEFGSFSALLGTMILLATVSSLSFHVAIPLASGEREASDLLWVVVLASAAIAPTGALCAVWLTGSVTGEAGARTWLALTLGAILLSAWAGLRAFAARQDRFSSISASGVVDSSTQAGTQITLGQLGFGAVGLVSGYLAGKATAVVVLLVTLRRSVLAPARLVGSGRTWIRYSLWVTPTTLLNQLSVTAVAPLVTFFFGVSTAGQFSLATRMLAAPAALVGQAVAMVFFPRFARLDRQGRSGLRAVEAVATALSVLAWPVFGITFLLGPELFALVFGPEWREAGVAAAVLSPWLALNLISSPISSVATVRGRLATLLALGVLEASLRVGALAAGAGDDQWYLSLAAYSAVGCVISLYTLAWVLRLSGGSLRRWLSTWRPASWAVLAIIGALAAAKPLVPIVTFSVASVMVCSLGAASALRQLVGLLGSPRATDAATDPLRAPD